jgi:hypothetical protein
MPIRPAIEEQLTMAPLPCLRIWRSSYFMQFHTPRRLIAITRSNSSLLASAISAASTLYTGVIERRIQATEGGYSLLDHCRYLSVISYVATDRECFVTLGSQFLGGRTHGLLIPVR